MVWCTAYRIDDGARIDGSEDHLSRRDTGLEIPLFWKR